MKTQIIEKPELGPLVSPRSNQRIPIHNWYPYKHSYSRELVIYLINNFKLNAGAWVLDPFCGGGTTLLTCKELGLNARGFDILPFSVFLSNVKVGSYNDADIVRQVEILKRSDKTIQASLSFLAQTITNRRHGVVRTRAAIGLRIYYARKSNTPNLPDLNELVSLCGLLGSQTGTKTHEVILGPWGF